jgi:hypothetical protein
MKPPVCAESRTMHVAWDEGGRSVGALRVLRDRVRNFRTRIWEREMIWKKMGGFNRGAGFQPAGSPGRLPACPTEMAKCHTAKVSHSEKCASCQEKKGNRRARTSTFRKTATERRLSVVGVEIAI